MNPGARMLRILRSLVAIASATLVLLALVWLQRLTSLPSFPSPWALFLILIFLTTITGVPLGGGVVSLTPMAAMTTFLALGLEEAGWAVFLAALLYGAFRYFFALFVKEKRENGPVPAFALYLSNATVQTASILIAGFIFQQQAGAKSLSSIDPGLIKPLIYAFLAYLGFNYTLAGLFLIVQGQAPLRLFLRSLPTMFLYEAAPLVFAPLAALVFHYLGIVWFLFFALYIGLWSLLARNLANARTRLEIRVNELNSLQTIGKTLSSSLELDTILKEIYTQVASLMPVRNFFVALYQPDTDEISFPLVFDSGKRLRWRTRHMGSGLTEYVIRTRQPLLVPDQFLTRVEALGVSSYGHQAECWLGVPLVAGSEIQGAICLQDYTKPNIYTEQHKTILTTIGTEAAIAVQNARLYSQTDQALSHRVQELDSIFRTATEGLILLDYSRIVLAANDAACGFLSVLSSDLLGKKIKLYGKPGTLSLAMIGYSGDSFIEACEHLVANKGEIQVRKVVLPSTPDRKFERSLAPVYGERRGIAGWLVILRDITKEEELAQQREEMIHMLVHDLRSPLASLDSGLSMLESLVDKTRDPDIDRLFYLARRGSERVLRLVDELLEINQMESERLLLNLTLVDVRAGLEELAAHLVPIAFDSNIQLTVKIEENLPKWRFDSDQITRVINNLLDNALKFTPGGGEVILWSRLETLPVDQDWLLIGITDTGPGIPVDSQERIFEKFEQVNSIKGRRRGTGLGLAYCRLAVEAHGGKIWVESQPGSGSTFIIRLPRIPEGSFAPIVNGELVK